MLLFLKIFNVRFERILLHFFENVHIGFERRNKMFLARIFLTNASNREEDRYMFRVKATMENVCVSLVKSPHFVSPSAGVKQEDPPRTMGDGFAILQTAMIQFYYHQDLLGNMYS